MKKFFNEISGFVGSITLMLAIFTSVLVAPTLASAQSPYWQIGNFDVTYDINQNGSINISEKIEAIFNSDYPRRGIFRYIPTIYENQYKHKLNLRFKLIGITDQNQQALTYEQISAGNFVDLKIGDEEIFHTTPQTYNIKYQFERGINSFEEHDEFYWNVTGNGFDTSINKATALINLPADIPEQDLQTACYTGGHYSTESNCTIELRKPNQIYIETTQLLNTSEGLTVVVGFPKNIISKPTLATLIFWFFIDNWGYLIPLIVFILTFLYWFKNGRDEKISKDTIMPRYEPPRGLKPGEIGALIDNEIQNHDITATIIDFAVRGALTIEEVEIKRNISNVFGGKKFYIRKIDNPNFEELLTPYEKTIYKKLFSYGDKLEIGKLANSFYTVLKKTKDQIYQSLISKGFYKNNPTFIRDTFFGIAGIFIFIAMILIEPLIHYHLSVFIGLIISAAIVFGFAFIMAKRTKLGTEVYYEVLGLKEFMKTAEKDRMDFYEKEKIFEKLLPYAIALNVVNSWAKTCEGLYKQAPEWYLSSSNVPFNIINFSNSFNQMRNTISNNIASEPRSSGSSASSGSSGFGGGGFSGGGFGGGGGRSW